MNDITVPLSCIGAGCDMYGWCENGVECRIYVVFAPFLCRENDKYKAKSFFVCYQWLQHICYLKLHVITLLKKVYKLLVSTIVCQHTGHSDPCTMFIFEIIKIIFNASKIWSDRKLEKIFNKWNMYTTVCFPFNNTLENAYYCRYSYANVIRFG